ncbi:hypothetical protein BRADI_3g06584v3 [Brachypodium distachyon]|uniref:Uncharacterized protein n=1 Tax=Brachypodium distachyon TaxID=15368 RepID=A0A2K2CVL0_BRADI|nr:hypothetical protein BRADI_3g06584v3 [Brachypodium distachyon]PNT66065.1 hypothetical protein BRADI_3g06584v3 [Brachypodium distachyon]
MESADPEPVAGQARGYGLVLVHRPATAYGPRRPGPHMRPLSSPRLLLSSTRSIPEIPIPSPEPPLLGSSCIPPSTCEPILLRPNPTPDKAIFQPRRKCRSRQWRRWGEGRSRSCPPERRRRRGVAA